VETQGTAEKRFGRLMFGDRRLVRLSPGRDGRDKLRGLVRSISPSPGMVRCPFFCPTTPPMRKYTNVKVKTVNFMMLRIVSRRENN